MKRCSDIKVDERTRPAPGKPYPDSELAQREQAYNALYKAAERIGYNEYLAQGKQHKGRKSTFRFTVTDAHAAVIKAMAEVLNGAITAEEAMGLLWDGEVMIARGVYS